MVLGWFLNTWSPLLLQFVLKGWRTIRTWSEVIPECHEGLFSLVVAEVALGSCTLFSLWMFCLSFSGWAFCTWCQSYQHKASSQPPHPCQGSGDQDWCSAEWWPCSDCCGTSCELPHQPCKDWSISLSRAVSARLNAIFPCPLQAALYFHMGGRPVCWAFPLGFLHPWLMVLAGLNPVCSSNTGNLCWLVGGPRLTWGDLTNPEQIRK